MSELGQVCEWRIVPHVSGMLCRSSPQQQDDTAAKRDSSSYLNTVGLLGASNKHVKDQVFLCFISLEMLWDWWRSDHISSQTPLFTHICSLYLMNDSVSHVSCQLTCPQNIFIWKQRSIHFVLYFSKKCTFQSRNQKKMQHIYYIFSHVFPDVPRWWKWKRTDKDSSCLKWSSSPSETRLFIRPFICWKTETSSSTSLGKRLLWVEEMGSLVPAVVSEWLLYLHLWVFGPGLAAAGRTVGLWDSTFGKSNSWE